MKPILDILDIIFQHLLSYPEQVIGPFLFLHSQDGDYFMTLIFIPKAKNLRWGVKFFVVVHRHLRNFV